MPRNARISARRTLAATAGLLLWSFAAPVGCGTAPASPSETLPEAVARVAQDGLRTDEQLVADHLSSELEPWELSYLVSLDWSLLTPGQVAADPVFHHAFVVADPFLSADARPIDVLGMSVARADCELAPVDAACAEGLWRALRPAIAGGVLLTACAGADLSGVGLPAGAVCAALALKLLRRAHAGISECASQARSELAAILECIEPSANADDYVDPLLASRAQLAMGACVWLNVGAMDGTSCGAGLGPPASCPQVLLDEVARCSDECGQATWSLIECQLASGATCNTYDQSLCQAAEDALTSCHGSCGNGCSEPGEQCEDGNVVAGDGCAADCTAE